MSLATAGTRSGLSVARIEHLGDLPAIEASWRRLQAVDPEATAFSTWEWCSAAARHFVPDGELRLFLAEQDGEPVALAPFARRRRLGMRSLLLVSSGLFEYSIADYQDVLIAPGHETEALTAIADRLDRGGDWDQVWLQDVAADSRLARLLPVLARERGWRVLIEPASETYSVSLPASTDAYVAMLSTNNRKALRRRTNKLRELGGRFETIETGADPLPAIETLFELHTRRWLAEGRPGIFRTEPLRAFHREAACNLHEAGMLDLTLVYAGEQAIAAQHCLDFNGRRHLYINGYDPDEAWQPLSLGSLLDVNRVEAAIEAGLHTVDLGRGEGDYKQRYAPVTNEKRHVYISRTASAHARQQLYSTLRRHAKRLLRRPGP